MFQKKGNTSYAQYDCKNIEAMMLLIKIVYHSRYFFKNIHDIMIEPQISHTVTEWLCTDFQQVTLVIKSVLHRYFQIFNIQTNISCQAHTCHFYNNKNLGLLKSNLEAKKKWFSAKEVENLLIDILQKLKIKWDRWETRR